MLKSPPMTTWEWFQTSAAALDVPVDDTQREAIEEALGAQLELDLKAKDELDQWLRDRSHLEQRLSELEKELKEQPESLKATYDVRLSRLTPVGMVYLWPSSR